MILKIEIERFYKKLLVLLSFIVLTSSLVAQTVTNFTASGSWTAPAGVTSITVECWGGGGAGAAVGGNPAAGGGGAGGAYARKVVSVTPGTNYTLTVGATKTSGSKTATATQNNGNPSWFGSTSTVFAQGGPGSAGGNNTNNFNGVGALGSSSSSIGDVVRAGGNGANGASASGVAGGAGGGAAGTAANGGNASAGTGGVGGAGNPSTGNGANGPANNTNGSAGSVRGGGGSGGKANTTTDRNGGSGAAGYVRITYYTYAAPTSLVATAINSSQINLTWVDNSNNETGFQIERSLTAGSGFVLISTEAPNITSFSDNGLNPQTTYYYRIRSIGTNGYSTYSIVANATTPSGPPLAPGGLTATPDLNTTINLSWTDNSSNESGFEIERSTSAVSGFTLISPTAPNVTSYGNSGLTSSTTYYYRVKAVNGSGSSSYTSVVSARTAVAAPSGLVATSTLATAVSLSWADNSADESYFEIERSLTSGSGFVKIFTTYANATSYQDGGLAPGTVYYYRVRAVDNYGNSAYTTQASATTPILTFVSPNPELAFQYRYDPKKRMTHKKVPGADWVYMVYDNRDRLVMTQDGNQRPYNKWSYTKYDAMNRPIVTGIYTHGSVIDQLAMSNLISTTVFHETRDNGVLPHGYTNNVFTSPNFVIANFDVHTVTYYDDYTFKTMWGGTSFNYASDGLTDLVYTQPLAEHSEVLGQVTGTKVKVLDGGSTFIKSINYYDNRYRAIQTIADTYKNGAIAGTDRTSMLYDFGGKVLKAQTKHLVGTASEKIVARHMAYDHEGRAKNMQHSTNGTTPIYASINQYNELGQLIDKKLHSTNASGTNAKQSVDYRYNIRGWLTSMNDASLTNNGTTNDDSGDLFGMNLEYNTNDLGLTSAIDRLYNGNISAMAWSNNLGAGTMKQNGYSYSYDNLNRIKTSVFKEKNTVWSTPANYALQETGFNYDLNGNITTLQRNDRRASGWMDNLSYNYSGNKLLRVTDSDDDHLGFVDGTNSGDDYTYDANGNMTRDLNKGIGTSLTDNVNLITYNFLNLPETVTKGSNQVRYVYDATGRKLSQITTFGTQQKRTDYIGEFQYENDLLQFVNHEDGRVVIAGNEQVFYHNGDATTNITAAIATLAPVSLNGQTYIQATAINSTTKQGMFPIGGTINVLPGEKYKIRAKGYHLNSNSVHLYIRTNGTDLSWPGARLASGSSAEAFTEQIITIPTGHTTLQAGVAWNTVVINDKFYLNEFEIIKLTVNSAPEYQYNLKDHLGNVRLTFTTTPPPAEVFTATYEDINSTAEAANFNPSYNNAVRYSAALYNRTPGGSKSQRLSAANANEIIGLAKSLKVIPGDTLKMEVYVKYTTPTTTNSNVGGLILSSISNAFGVNASSTGDGSLLYQSLAALNNIGQLINTGDDVNPALPKAYINYILFDEKFVPYDGGFTQVTADALETGGGIPHKLLQLQQVVAKPGYAYIYLSNENDKLVDVYFDDLKITHSHGPVVQSDDYYPFGLAFNSYSFKNSAANNYLYNGKELQGELNLGWMDYGARMYMPELGRWGVVDLLADMYDDLSPYHYALNNPVNFLDPNGMNSESVADLVQKAWNSTPEGSNAKYDSDGNCSCGCPGKPPCEEKKDAEIKIGHTKVLSPGQGIRQNGQVYETPGNHKCDENCTLDHFDEGDMAHSFAEVGLFFVGGQAVKWVLRGGKWVLTAANVSRFGQFAYANKYGIKGYKALTSLTKGKGLQVHHLIEKRFAAMLGQNSNDMASIALTQTEHQVFTNAWRNAIPYGEGTINATREQVMNAAKQIYKDYPEILNALGLK